MSTRSRIRLLPLFCGTLLTIAPFAVHAIGASPLGTGPTTKSLSTLAIVDPMDAAFREGVTAYEIGQYDTAIKAWHQPAERGHAGAQFTLGVAYATGKGTVADLARAAELWEAAAIQGHTAAQFNLGVLYSRGDGVEKDLVKARRWWSLAANAGDAGAQFHLGALAAIGEGGPRNLEEAARWWTLAAAQGVEQAQKGLEILRAHGALPNSAPTSSAQ